VHGDLPGGHRHPAVADQGRRDAAAARRLRPPRLPSDPQNDHDNRRSG